MTSIRETAEQIADMTQNRVWFLSALENAIEAALLAERERMKWQPIETLDFKEMHFVLVEQDGAIRLRLWNPHRSQWERSDGFCESIQSGDECPSPTHWMPLPEPPATAIRSEVEK